MNKKVLLVTNRSAGMVVYTIPEEGIRREFTPGETKKIPFEELEKLAYLSGGRTLMENFLKIVDTQTTEELGIHTEPEYYLDDAGVIKLLTEGTLDEFLDCLDFAPIGVIDLIKTMSVQLPITDMAKREALKAKTGFDVDKAIENDRVSKEDDKKETIADKPAERRVTESAPAGRRTSGNAYKVVKQTETKSAE